jgi:hypothetical protein
MRAISLGLVCALSAFGCGGDDEGPCDPVAQSGCDDGQVCEAVDGADEPACFDPVLVRGRVFDLADDQGIAGARVVALDVNGAPASSVAVTGSDGSYDLSIPSTRATDGTPAALDLTLRADAVDYQTFPSGLRQALPIDTGAAVVGEGGWIVESALTDIGLIALAETAGGRIVGDVEVPPGGGGVLVVAENAGGGFAAIADRDGDYAILNVPPGDYNVAGYARGVNYEPAQATVGGGEVTADLALSDAATATLSGNIQIVAGGSGPTSIILVVASTFDPVLARGATPPGLRVPDPGTAPDVTGAFTIDGVPAGTYKIHAAFENDTLVRDPDTCIAGTDIVEQQVGAGDDIAIEESFKVTDALQLQSPGAAGPEEVTSDPTIAWQAYPSADGYDILVFDAFGTVVWEQTEPDTTTSVTYGGDPLQPGMYYQVRITTWRQVGGVDICEITQTEYLKGVFFVP